MELVNLHVLNGSNVGDSNCAPLQFFSFPGVSGRIEGLERWPDIPKEIPVIVGGGGILHAGFKDDVGSLIGSRGPRVIFWGGGLNDHGLSESTYPDYMQRAALVGVRDWDRGFPWVPCPSCMSPLFDTKRRATREIVIYDHAQYLVPVKGFDRLSNYCSDLRQVLDFLGSAETVFTSSYHGAYWATLLGRKVVAFPFSSKFSYFRHEVGLASEGDWEGALRRARPHPSALAESREANVAFFDRVGQFLEKIKS